MSDSKGAVMNDVINLSDKTCEACEGIKAALNKEQIDNLMGQVKDWEVSANHHLKKSFKFADFYQTMSFVNALAWIANQENHHPDLSFGYNYCEVTYFTHAVDGLTQNDFICAAKIDKLLV